MPTTHDRGTLNEEDKTAIEGTPAREETWSLTQTGNWKEYHTKVGGASVLDQTRTNNKANEILSTTEAENQTQWAEPEYDARGNMITVPKPDSPASAFTCTWDAWNRMAQVKDKDTGQIIATYRYDGTRRRITKLLGTDPENPTATYDYYHSARQILETRKNGIANPYEQHVWGLRYVHSPVCRFYDPDTDGENVEKLYYTNDANFNVTALVGTDGTVVERCAYDPYGKVTFYDSGWSNPSSTSSYGNTITFTGHRLDTESGLYYGDWRYYHPTLGLWISRDPIGHQFGVNPYQYVSGNATTFCDPFGLVEWKKENCKKVNIGGSMLQIKVYALVGFSADAGLELEICDCCKGDERVEDGYVSGGLAATVRLGFGIGEKILGTGWALEGPGIETNPKVTLHKECDGNLKVTGTLTNIEVHIGASFGFKVVGTGLKGGGGAIGAITIGYEGDEHHFALTVEPSVSAEAHITWSIAFFSRTHSTEKKLSGKGRLGYDWSAEEVILDWTNTSNE